MNTTKATMIIATTSEEMVVANRMLSFDTERVETVGSLVHMHLSGSAITTEAVDPLIYTWAVSSTFVIVDSSSIALQLKRSHTLSTSKSKVVS